MSDQNPAGGDDETTPAVDRSALADDDYDLAEALKLATGRCPLGLVPAADTPTGPDAPEEPCQ